MQSGYDEFKTLLLPPREPSDRLPRELLEWYETNVKKAKGSGDDARDGELTVTDGKQLVSVHESSPLRAINTE